MLIIDSFINKYPKDVYEVESTGYKIYYVLVNDNLDEIFNLYIELTIKYIKDMINVDISDKIHSIYTKYMLRKINDKLYFRIGIYTERPAHVRLAIKDINLPEK